jgi:cyanate lyase
MTWKELIQEEFGDGVMSAIDFDMTLRDGRIRLSKDPSLRSG